MGIAKGVGCNVTGVWVKVPLEDALRRNALRQGLGRVPEHVIRHVFESLEPPTPEDGFHQTLVIEDLAAGA